MSSHLVTSHLVKVVRLHNADPSDSGSEWSLNCEQVDLGHPGSEEVSLQQTSIAVILEDVFDCEARAAVSDTSGEFTPGRAAAGIVTAVGPLVTALKIGDRVVYTSGPSSGAFCAARVMSVRHLTLVPTGVAMEVVPHALLEGIPALDLLKSEGPVGEGKWVLVADAVRGKGLVLGQVASQERSVIVTVGSEAEQWIAKECGFEHVVMHSNAGFEEDSKSITKGVGISAVFFPRNGGSNEEAMFQSCMADGAKWVSYGEPLHVGRIEEEVEIDDKSIGHLEEYAKEILQLLKEGAIKYPIGKSFTLERAREALEAVKNRVCVEGVLIVPSPPSPQELATCT